MLICFRRWVSLTFLVLTEKPTHSCPQISASLLLLFLVLPWLWWTLTSQSSVLSTRSRDTTYCALKSLIFLPGHQDEYLPCEKDGLHLTWGCIPFFGSTWHEKTFMIPPSPPLTILNLKWPPPPKEAPQSFLPPPLWFSRPLPPKDKSIMNTPLRILLIQLSEFLLMWLNVI